MKKMIKGTLKARINGLILVFILLFFVGCSKYTIEIINNAKDHASSGSDQASFGIVPGTFIKVDSQTNGDPDKDDGTSTNDSNTTPNAQNQDNTNNRNASQSPFDDFDNPTDQQSCVEPIADTGSGSGTLVVKATVDIRLDHQAGVYFKVEVSDANGAPVSGASVIITDTERAYVLLETAPGVYTASSDQSSPSYRLFVKRGTDFIGGARLDTPSIHNMSDPQEDGYYEVYNPVPVSWSMQKPAMAIEIYANDYRITRQQDTGSFNIPSTILQELYADSPDQMITLYRENWTGLNGGLAGSIFRVRVVSQRLIHLMMVGIGLGMGG